MRLPNDPAQQPAHAGGGSAPRRAVRRVAGLLRRLGRPGRRSRQTTTTPTVARAAGPPPQTTRGSRATQAPATPATLFLPSARAWPARAGLWSTLSRATRRRLILAPQDEHFSASRTRATHEPAPQSSVHPVAL